MAMSSFFQIFLFLGYGDKINESKDIRDDKMLFYNLLGFEIHPPALLMIV